MQQSAISRVKGKSSLLVYHAYPVVAYNIGHTTPNTQPGGRNGTLFALFFKFGHSALVKVIVKAGRIVLSILYFS